MTRILSTIVVIVLLVHGCGGESPPQTTTDTPPTADDTAVPDTTVSPTDVPPSADVESDVGPIADTLEDVVLDDVEPVADTSDPDAVLDASDTIEEVEVAPPPCQSDDDCLENISSNTCKRPACNPASGLCIEVDQPVGTPCETNNLCKSGQVCQSGQCIGGSNVNCVDDDPCTTDMCDPAQGCIFPPVDDCCIPDCDGKTCGTDGCGGSCGVCQAEWSCNVDGICINCVPNCIGLTCGADGCGGVCGVCPDEWFCIDPGICMECLPECEGKQCGGDSCGGSCGDCGGGQVCDDDGLCTVCLADCEGKQCGSDGCGGLCGSCSATSSCSGDGVCVCIPNCGGKTCGDNGCGGTCGDCPVGEVCTFLDLCEVVLAGKTCDSPIPVPGVPFYTIQNTSDAFNLTEMPGGLCGFSGDVGGASPEHVYAFTPTENGTYTFQVEPLTFDAAVYLVNDCGNPQSSCLSGSDEEAKELIAVSLTSEKTYYLIVDGHNNLNAAQGQYSLSIYAGLPVSCTASCEGKSCGTDGCGGSCGTCGDGDECSTEGVCEAVTQGDTCEHAIPVGALPFSVGGSTSDMAPDYNISSGSCTGIEAATGQGASDIVYGFTPSASGNYVLTVPTLWDAVVYVVTDCGAVSDTCVAFENNAEPSTAETFVTYLMADQTYYIIVDGNSWNTNLGGDLTFKIDHYVPDACTPICSGLPCGPDGCGGFCGLCEPGTFCENNQCVGSPLGDSCESAFPVNAIPYYATSDTTGAQADYSFSANSCPGEQGGWGLKGSDQVYKFTPMTTGVYEIDVAVQYDALVYVVTDCDAIDSHCVVAVDNDGLEAESIVIQLEQGTDYFIIIDYWSNSVDGTGEYAITIDQSCVANCLGMACGTDGCGGSCGDCPGNDACVGGACASLTVAGESCDNPFEFTLGIGSYYANGDTTGAGTDVTHNMGECWANSTPADGPDHVYAVTALTNASYTVTLHIPEDEVDLKLWVATDCSDTANSCITGSDSSNFAGTTEVVTFDATMGETYYVVVDSAYTEDGPHDGPYELEFVAQE